MKVLLDECLPRHLKRALSPHEIQTVREAGWSGIKNGELLNLAEPLFEVFLTADRNLRYQQNLAKRKLPSWKYRQTGWLKFSEWLHGFFTPSIISNRETTWKLRAQNNAGVAFLSRWC